MPRDEINWSNDFYSDMFSLDFESLVDLKSFSLVISISLALRARLIANHSPDYPLNCTPLSPITISKNNLY